MSTRSSWAAVRTVRQAVARHGLYGLGSRIVGTLLRGGPALLLQKCRAVLAAGNHEATYVQRDSIAPSTPVGSTPPPAGGPVFSLRSDYTLPLLEFNDYLDRWDKHPAILDLLISDAASHDLSYTIVLSRHSDSGWLQLGETLVLARNLAQRAAMDVRVIAYDPDNGIEQTAHESAGSGVSLVTIGTTKQLLELLTSSPPQHLVHFLVCGDQITPVLAEVLARSTIPRFDLVLTDMYLVDRTGDVLPIFLPGLDLIHALNVDYFLSRALMRAGLAAELLRAQAIPDAHAAVTAALARRATPGSGLRALHVAFPLVRINETPSAILKRRVECLNREPPLRLARARNADVRADSTVQRVSIVICTKNNGFLLEQLVERLLGADTDRIADIVVITNQTTNPYAAGVAERLAAEQRLKLVNYDKAFNFSAQCNLGAAVGEGELLLFLNDDVVPVNRDWLKELAAPLEHPSIGVVGPLLLYPDQSVQHAGMFVGFNNLAGHTLRGAQLPGGDYGFMASAPRQVMSVTGAALCMRRCDFEALNGFDQNLFALHIQDVDLCLRAHYSGLAVVYNPRSVLIHMESVSVKPTLADPRIGERRGREHAAFLRRWGHMLRDDFHNRNFSRTSESLREIVRP